MCQTVPFKARWKGLWLQLKGHTWWAMVELYSRDILKLSTTIPNVGEPKSFTHMARKVSRICGSKLTLWVTLDDDTITDFGLDVKACALGQAATSLIAQHMKGMTRAQFQPLDAAYRQMVLDGVADFPKNFQDFCLLKPVHDHKSRRGSALLPFDCLTEIFELSPRT